MFYSFAKSWLLLLLARVASERSRRAVGIEAWNMFQCAGFSQAFGEAAPAISRYLELMAE